MICYNRAKEAVKYIKTRLLKKNPRIQFLALKLLGTAMNKCSLSFHSQVCSKDFLKALVTILGISEMPEQIILLILSLIQQWAIRFNDQQDILPLFGRIYDQLQKRGFKFQNFESKQEVNPSNQSYVSREEHIVPAKLQPEFETIKLMNVIHNIGNDG